MTDLSAPMFTNENAARAHLESMLWPDGPVCPHCGVLGQATKMEGRSHRAGVFHCNACEKPFSVTVGTVMESSHIPLNKWVLAFHLMAASKKGMSAAQLSRMLNITYKSAWFLAHRIREAMTETEPARLGGEGKVIEADEMYHGTREIPVPSEQRKDRPYLKKSLSQQKRPVIGLVERHGEARAIAIIGKPVTAENVREVLIRHVERSSHLHTDESRLYPVVGREFVSHATVNHAKEEYVRYERGAEIDMITTNWVEGLFGTFKRGFTGTYQHCGEQHFQRYLNEFTFRYNYRIKLGFTDDQRAAITVRKASGKRLKYRGTGSAQNA